MGKRKWTRAERRAPFPERPGPEPDEPAGRTSTTETPLHIRTFEVDLEPSLRDYLRQRLGFKLGKFAPRIRRVSVRLVNESGPKGPPALACRIKVMLDPGSVVFVEHVHADVRPAIDGAIDRIERSVRRSLQRVRKPRRG